ncbi:MAG TPA: FKBP-type peptidyl-prolyl cis-trans isomerase [Fimbriiglobus sp.]|nr:FKBP-type peptidyl-prolyl cis-trans isomerase [Fimbriiglobus sp.]
MEPLRFRPRLEAIEDRVTPSVTPTEVFAAAFQTAQARETLRGLFQHLGEPMNVYEKPFWASFLPTLVQDSRAAHDDLAEFGNSLQTQSGSNATLAAALAPTLGRARALQAQAAANAFSAGVYAVGFGVPVQTVFPAPGPKTPPPFPGGAPFPDKKPTTPLNPQDDSGMTNTLPPVNASEWRTTASGLKIWDVVEGTGNAAVAGGNATVHYTGWLTSGTVFDSSRKDLATRPGVTGEPVDFSLKGVIQGWKEGIPGLKVGGIRRLFVPAALGYGAAGTSSIPPNSDLVFEVKLADVS